MRHDTKTYFSNKSWIEELSDEGANSNVYR